MKIFHYICVIITPMGNMRVNRCKKIFAGIKAYARRCNLNVNVLIFVLALLCLYAIIQIKFDFAFWVGSSVYANKINEIITNLSYSYLAGYVFFLLTVTLPHLKMKDKIRKALISKVKTIITNYEACLESVLPLSSKLKDELSKEDAMKMFRAVSYMAPCRLSSIGQDVCVATYIKIKHEENLELATQLLEYKPWLSSTSMEQIESIRNSSLSKVIIALTQKNLTSYLDNEDSRGKIASDVYDLWDLSKQIIQSIG